VDFFTPIVDDPYDFGRIAAANALSDIYAMGGVPKTALNIVAFPISKMDKSILRAILEGGRDKLIEAGAVMMGGHSIEDDEMKYGLAVTGFVHPQKILANQGLHPGDQLILTKPLGTGIIATAGKAGLATADTLRQTTEQMATLNKSAAEAAADFDISACTDITGFGLIGHLAEMIAGCTIGLKLNASQIPYLREAYDFAAMGFVPAGAHKNRAFRQHLTNAPASFDPVLRDVLYDPQTSGGLLFGCAPDKSRQLLASLHDHGITAAAIIGEATSDMPGKINLCN